METKFRAWDIEQKKMIDWNTMLYPFDNENDLLPIMMSWFKGYELMQYTGLKDKYWKEVYEWDILKEGSCISIVKRWVIDIQVNEQYWWNKVCWCYLQQHWLDIVDNCHMDDIDKTEIIWNIYENKELNIF